MVNKYQFWKYLSHGRFPPLFFCFNTTCTSLVLYFRSGAPIMMRIFRKFGFFPSNHISACNIWLSFEFFGRTFGVIFMLINRYGCRLSIRIIVFVFILNLCWRFWKIIRCTINSSIINRSNVLKKISARSAGLMPTKQDRKSFLEKANTIIKNKILMQANFEIALFCHDFCGISHATGMTFCHS